VEDSKKEGKEMNLKDFKEKVFTYAEKAGFKEYELYYSKSDTLNINVYDYEVDKYSVSSSVGVSLRGIFDGKMGYAYTESIDDSAAEMLVNSAKDNAASIEDEDEEFIYAGKDEYSSLSSYNESLAQVSADKKIKLALALEKEARAKSEKVVNIGHCGIGSAEAEYGIMNSKGIDLTYKSNFIYGAVAPVVTDGKRMYNGMCFKLGRDIEDIKPEEISGDAVKEALSCIGASSVKSGVYKVALRNDVAATLLSVFSGAFSAENVQKGLSLLKGKMGDKIAAENVTILDDPLMKNGFKSCPFDAEGVAAYRKEVVKEGTLSTLLYNLKTAVKDGVKTTGNASKASYSSPVTVAPTNFYFEKGTKSFKELIEYIGEGLLITDLAGTHSGANPVTGDFSLAAKGYLIENGQIGNPVEQITIASNFFSLLQNVEEIGCDLEFNIPSGSGYFGSPTIVVSEISVAGN
jgi:PmbA protein